jgi:hypothetical protein
MLAFGAVERAKFKSCRPPARRGQASCAFGISDSEVGELRAVGLRLR